MDVKTQLRPIQTHTATQAIQLKFNNYIHNILYTSI